MDPITAALAAGTAAGQTDVASQAARARLKAALSSRFPQLEAQVHALESRPDRQDTQSSLAAELAEVGAQSDAELLQLAKILLDAIQREAPEAAARVGVDLQQVRAGGSVDARLARGREGGPAGERLRQFEESRKPRLPEAQAEEERGENAERE